MREKRTDAQTARKLARYRKLRATLASTQQQLDALAAEIQAYFGDADQLISADGAEILATYKLAGGGLTFDVKRFKAEKPKLYEKYQVEKKAFRVLRVK